jgi:hypothetical protein
LQSFTVFFQKQKKTVFEGRFWMSESPFIMNRQTINFQKKINLIGENKLTAFAQLQISANLAQLKINFT